MQKKISILASAALLGVFGCSDIRSTKDICNDVKVVEVDYQRRMESSDPNIQLEQEIKNMQAKYTKYFKELGFTFATPDPNSLIDPEAMKNNIEAMKAVKQKCEQAGVPVKFSALELQEKMQELKETIEAIP